LDKLFELSRRGNSLGDFYHDGTFDALFEKFATEFIGSEKTARHMKSVRCATSCAIQFCPAIAACVAGEDIAFSKLVLKI
jgi:hypothetical protein